ncbi:MAG: gamma-glutamyltransferase [Pseudomonadota bacterium]
MGDGYIETWNITKPERLSGRGVVTTQHRLASAAGARVLARGGNAVDAAVTAALTIGAVEPWMSGTGGGGIMLIYLAAEQRTYAVDFTMLAPQALNPADYPLSEGDGGDLFGWPAVEGDRNVNGPFSFAVPGNVAGLALALERFGTLDFADAISPAIEHAEAGMPADWYASLKIASGAAVLARFPESARVYLPGGHVPCGEWGGEPPRIQLGNLAHTLKRLREAGPRDFYEGEIAATICRDMQAVGGLVGAADLRDYQAQVKDVTPVDYRGHQIHAAPGLTAGPTLLDALRRLSAHTPGHVPDPDMYLGYANALTEAYAERLATMGDVDDSRAPACTTHMSIADADGNVVALTQTLLSVFGSKVMLPESGILWNNGVMWFDPRPGRPNSMAPGKRPLANMCPTIVVRDDGARFALGASGGRRIMPAVFQLASFLTDYRMNLDAAMHQGRIDYCAGPEVGVDRVLGDAVLERIAACHPAAFATHGVYPALYACPNTAGISADGRLSGAAFVMSPWAHTAIAEDF